MYNYPKVKLLIKKVSVCLCVVYCSQIASLLCSKSSAFFLIQWLRVVFCFFFFFSIYLFVSSQLEVCGLSCSAACSFPTRDQTCVPCFTILYQGSSPLMTFHLTQRKIRLLQRPSRMCILTSSSWPHKPWWPVKQSSSEPQQLFPWRETLFSTASTIYSLRHLLKSLQCIPPLPRYLKLPSLLWAVLLCFIFLYHTDHGQRNYDRSVVSDPLWPHGLQPARLLYPQNFTGKNTGVGCHALLQDGGCHAPPRDGTWVSCISCIGR